MEDKKADEGLAYSGQGCATQFCFVIQCIYGECGAAVDVAIYHLLGMHCDAIFPVPLLIRGNSVFKTLLGSAWRLYGLTTCYF